MENINAIILAAGEGTRMKSRLPKVLHEVMGKTMVKRVVDTAKELGAENICVVTGHKAEEVQESLRGENVEFALQKEQLGTGHAVMQAERFIDDSKDVLILYGDTPLISADTLKRLVEYHRNENNGVSIISAVVENSEGYGHIIRNKSGAFVKNVEYKDATDEEKLVKEINSGIYCFKGSSLKKALKLITNDNVQGEYYLPDALEIILRSGEKVNAMAIGNVAEFAGVNNRVQLAQANRIMRERINERHMLNGVTIISTENTYIYDDVKIGMDTIIYPGCVLEGNTVIGEGCSIGPDTRLTDMRLADNVAVQYTVAMESEIGSGTKVGPFAYIRPNSKIGENIKIGDFVEVKNSVIGNGTKVSHLTYIGDSDVGERINFGCGTVTVNYDGKKKYRTVIEDDVFIGCNANLVAPVTLKKGSYVAAGSTITKDVPEKSLAVARNRQQNIDGWAKK
ncbi:bifunctional UDP-N-acetylglucosamine diphosphorylase/glucosamine-1-phosphate N-acetyltransferase GlmU [Lachnospiraceae bacterium NSJ-143]|nr:bifunctional UDP-N-acetylglucosamine diphosphorylase/glucosamine-1-phosphate N-acetyltransferase GlmU [Lachnospiraceae bacterium NSJ-143]